MKDQVGTRIGWNARGNFGLTLSESKSEVVAWIAVPASFEVEFGLARPQIG